MSHYLHEKGPPVTHHSSCQLNTETQLGSFNLCPSPVVGFPLPWTSVMVASMSPSLPVGAHRLGLGTWRMPDGWNFCIFSLPWRICTYPRDLCYVSLPPCETLPLG